MRSFPGRGTDVHHYRHASLAAADRHDVLGGVGRRARSFNDVFGPRYKPALGTQTLPERPQRAHDAAEALLRWNEIAMNASGLDHTPVAAGENRIFGEQFGPGRASRAMAIVHIAMFDAVNAIVPRIRGLLGA